MHVKADHVVAGLEPDPEPNQTPPAESAAADDPTPAVSTEQPEPSPAVTRFQHPGTVLVDSGAKSRARANLAAIGIVNACATEGRPATPQEQDQLARWSGWGAIPKIFDPDADEWATEREELRAALSADDYTAAKASGLNAHYTDPGIAAAMWDALTDAGFDGGYVLEPGCGSGNFMGLAPDTATMIGVENDPVTAQIAHLLYPDAQVRSEGFEETRIPENTFSAVIGNVPFGKVREFDPVHNPQGHLIHNHFLIKSLALTAPGGYVMAITSAGTLNAMDSRARRDMHAHADLLGAVRLPGNAFTRVAGTQVVTDILVFRKRELGQPPATQLPEWLDSEKAELPAPTTEDPTATDLADVNAYFSAHPENVLGTVSIGHGLYRGDSLRVDSSDTAEQLHQQVRSRLTDIITAARSAGDGYQPQPSAQRQANLDAGVATAEELYAGEVTIGHVWWDDAQKGFLEQGLHVPEPVKVPKSRVTETKHLLRLRDQYQQLITAQIQDTADSGASLAEQSMRRAAREEMRAALNRTYDAYVDAYGPINRFKWEGGRERTDSEATTRFNALVKVWRADVLGDGTVYIGEIPDDALEKMQEQAWQSTPRMKTRRHMNPLRQDPDIAKVYALERFDEETGKASKAAIFFRDVVVAPTPVTTADTPEDALSIAIAETGHVDLGRIAGLLGQTPSQARESVRGLVYRDVDNPDTLLPAAIALSGNVRAKHVVAAAALAEAPRDRDWQEVTAALAEVIPTDKLPSQIGEVKIGATWIEQSDYEQFVKDTFGVKTVAVRRGAGTWKVTVPTLEQHSALMVTEFGADFEDGRKSLTADELFEKLLNQQPLVIRNSAAAREEGAPEVDAQASTFASLQADKIATEFRNWLWDDEDRRERLLTKWNSLFNTWVKPEHSGTNLTLPGLSPAFEPHPYQRDGVARIIAEPTVLLDHVVGAGKTGTMFMSAMELKRRGLVRQPWIVVPTHLIEQFGRELPQWYPAANVLLGKKGMSAEERRIFVAQTATSDWDIVIIPDSVFERIKVHPQRRVDYIKSQVADLDDELTAAREQKDATVKTIERAKAALDEKLKRATDQAAKDPGITFEQTGCDYLFVDEAHGYKNRTRNCAIDSLALRKGADKADDLAMKLDYLRDQRQAEARLAGIHVQAGAERVATFATGTPIANSLSEAWVMQTYLRPDVLEAAGVKSLTDWAASFTATKSETVTNATGTRIMVVTKVSAFSNPREMFQMSAQFTDVVTREQVPVNLPTFHGRTVTTTVPGIEVRDFIADLEHRLGQLDPRRPQYDNVLKVLSDGRNVALDPMLANLAPDSGNTRAAAVAGQVARIYHENKTNIYRTAEGAVSPTPGALQLVFCDLGTPQPGKRSVYDNLRDLLDEQGVPRESVAFIHDAKTDVQRLALQERCRNGGISVLIGSTPKMGTGLNVQGRMVALHHMDVPWRPADLEQREGRLIRQGNQNTEVALFTYVTEGTTDTVMWATVESKAAFIQQAKTGQLPDDLTMVDDVGADDHDLASAAAATKAAATGDPRYIRMAELDSELSALTALDGAHRDARRHARSAVAAADRTIDRIERELPVAEGHAARVDEWEGKGKLFSVDGVAKLERKDRSALLIDRARAVMGHLKAASSSEGVRQKAELAEVNGVPVTCQYSATQSSLYVKFEVPGADELLVTYEHLYGKQDAAARGHLDTDAPKSTKSSLANGLTTRLENAYAHLREVPDQMRAELDYARTEIDTYSPRLDAPFEQATELAQAQAELHALRLQIKQHENSEAAIRKRQEAATRIASQGRSPGWSLELNPTKKTVEEAGDGNLTREAYVQGVHRMHRNRAIKWAQENGMPSPVVAAEHATAGISSTPPATRSTSPLAGEQQRQDGAPKVDRSRSDDSKGMG